MENENLLNLYFENNLSINEKVIFEQLKLDNEEFRKEFIFRVNLQKAFALQEKNKLKKQLQQYEQEKKQKRNYLKYIAAASIAIFFSLIFLLNHGQSNEELYVEYYKTCPNLVAPTVRGEQQTDLKSKAFFAYDNENYTDSFNLFSKLYTFEKTEYALFYKAISLMEMKKYEDAKLVFETFDLKGNSELTTTIKWYKALVLLKLNKKKETVEILKNLQQTNNMQQKIAKDLLDDLN